MGGRRKSGVWGFSEVGGGEIDEQEMGRTELARERIGGNIERDGRAKPSLISLSKILSNQYST